MVPRVSLVVVSYEMARELPRTLASLSPPYQRGKGEWEIIVVDNGSRATPREADFSGLGVALRILRTSVTTPSPVRAINEGLAAARGGLIGVWIDGARLASPGLVSACLAASALHPRPVIATLNYQLGPDLQRISAASGYDQAREDALLASIGWPGDGYGLFDIATPEMRGGPAGAMLESNALFLTRAMWDALGGYDERFSEPGGSAANPDALIRAVRLPGAQLIRIVGEGTFHQIHSGMSTTSQERAMAVVKEASKAYLRLRGEPLVPVRERGWLFDARTGGVVR